MVQRPSYPVSSHYQPPSPPPSLASPQPWPPSSAGRPQPGPSPSRAPGHRQVRAVAPSETPAKPQPRQVLMAGGSMLALAALLITPNLKADQANQAEPFTCIRQEQPQALISRGQVKKLLETELHASKTTVREFLNVPYCVLSPGKTEGGLPAEREAYPLEFDPQTWLVVLYDGDRYVGYDFRFR